MIDHRSTVISVTRCPQSLQLSSSYAPFWEQIMSADKYPSILSRQTKAIVSISKARLGNNCQMFYLKRPPNIKIDSLGLHVTTEKVIENCIIKEWKKSKLD